MRTITGNDIQDMMQRYIQEALKVSVGKGKNQKILIKPGFKIIHKKSGLTYTVDDVKIRKGKVVIIAHSGDGNEIVLTHKDFKHYEGL